MNVNFFAWLREGVKHSVLLGVGDAVDQLGTPPQSEQVTESLKTFLGSSANSGQRPGLAGPTNPATIAGSQRAARKRLGRSLKDLDHPNAASS
jgi:hypothetical protein